MRHLRLIGAKAIDESTRNGGLVRDYFERSAGWEAKQRYSFKCLAERLVKPAEDVQAEAGELLTLLDNNYRGGGRYWRRQFPSLAGLIVREVRGSETLMSSPPDLLIISDAEAKEKVADFVRLMLDKSKEQGLPRLYSLVTKFLHFCFPNTFPIFDSQAAASIQMWSYFAFADGPEDARKDWTTAALSDFSRCGYHRVVRFYREWWQALTDEQREAVVQCAEALQGILQGVYVSRLDLLDKFLWKAKGDPIKLGLCQP